MACSITRRLLIGTAASTFLANKTMAEETAASPELKTETSKAPNLILTEQLLHATTLIEIFDSKEQKIGTATGFFFRLFLKGENSIEVIVTNRHVVESASSVVITLTRTNARGLPDFGNNKRVRLVQWISHPDPKVDLAIIALGPTIGPMVSAGEKFMIAGVAPDLIATDEELRNLTPLEDVLVIGYPDGLSDTTNNVPVFRRGITATPVYLDFQNEPKFLLDAAIFGGSSGSPVFLFNQGSWQDRAGHFSIGTRLKLLGVVFAVAQHKINGEIVMRPAPTQLKPVVETLIPNNVGVCIKASKILDFEPILIKRGLAKLPDGYVLRSKYIAP